MLIDRRGFLAGAAASVAAAAFPAQMARALPRPAFVPRLSPRFSPDTEFQLGHRAIRRFIWLSRWHFDSETYPGHDLLRHEGTGLTFRIEQDPDFAVYVRRVFLRRDPTDLAHRRYLIVGHAARRVAKDYWPTHRKCGRQIFDLASNYHRAIIWLRAPPLRLDA